MEDLMIQVFCVPGYARIVTAGTVYQKLSCRASLEPWIVPNRPDHEANLKNQLALSMSGMVRCIDKLKGNAM